MKKYSVLGLMSGTSLDGLDCCAVNFKFQKNKWTFKMVKTETFQYNPDILSKIENSKSLSALNLLELNIELGKCFGEICKTFINSNNLNIDFIASHGHTVYHQPEKKITLQIGEGQIISSITNLPVVFDFRKKDVLSGGQGAPLVPIGDDLLFAEYDICINLGGIANLSYKLNNQRLAYDVCACNMGLNYLANQLNLKYDESGNIAKSGEVDSVLLKKLNSLLYFKMPFPKSLGAEWFDKEILSILNNSNISINDKLATFTEHISFQIAEILNSQDGKSVLITGGGALNVHLIDLIKKKTNKNIEIPSKQIIEFKEALIFAFLGVLRLENIDNVLSSVTGAPKNTCSGVVVYP